MRLIFATNNKHKMSEITEILGEKYKDFVFKMSDLDIAIDPEENGKSFLENATIKSTALYKEMESKNLLKDDDYIISDDTGLCIDFLNGEPGIYSARYIGTDISQDEKNLKILDMMKDIEDSERTAYFITVLSVIHIIDAKKHSFESLSFEGKIDGYIAKSIEKTEGFGYDPIFAVGDTSDISKGSVKTYSNIGISEKNKISHRARALHNFVLYLAKKHNI
ncbi:MAG: RdgB/HAM1 family non-canonical purine NTP pyrophosphatase [Lachnospiraceae bacterium]|nr:RdgB/HAM1 family non-canonical purine NTP pyrophosphatase [Lachnospiraceae bacterium]